MVKTSKTKDKVTLKAPKALASIDLYMVTV
jgi:hypothetical protein